MLSIVQTDTIWPDDGDVRSVEIADTDLGQGTKNTYCVGMKFSSGDIFDPNSWNIDHIHYWDTDNDPNGDSVNETPRAIDEPVFMEFLHRHHAKFEDVLGSLLNGFRSL